MFFQGQQAGSGESGDGGDGDGGGGGDGDGDGEGGSKQSNNATTFHFRICRVTQYV